MILQFIPSRPASVMDRLIRSLAGTGVLAVLDLEDGQWDLADPRQTPALKQQARERLLDWSASGQDGRPPVPPPALRLNPFGSAEFARDLPVARELAATRGLAMILLPKVDRADTPGHCRQALAGHGLPPCDLVPLVESRAGRERLPEIAAATREAGGSAVVYGHYDYSLEAGHWPLWSDKDAPFWEFVAGFAATVEAAGLRYIHPPPPTLHDAPRLATLFQRLQQCCRREFGLFSAGLSQTPLLRQLAARPPETAPPPTLPAPTPLPQAEKRRLAETTVALFLQHRHSGLSFSSDPQKHRFIPPHEYLAARRFLEEERHG